MADCFLPHAIVWFCDCVNYASSSAGCMDLHNLWIALMGLTCLARKEEVIEEECKPEMKYWNDRH